MANIDNNISLSVDNDMIEKIKSSKKKIILSGITLILVITITIGGAKGIKKMSVKHETAQITSSLGSEGYSKNPKGYVNGAKPKKVPQKW